jgi:histidinol dehydrogenase
MPMTEALNIQRIDYRSHDVHEQVAALRKRLSVRGDIVSEAGKQRTIAVFGEPLTPQQVVERICDDVRSGGIDAMLDYTARIDQVSIDRDALRVEAGELEAAHRAADASLLGSVRAVRKNLVRFQQAILHEDVVLDVPGGGSLRQRYRPLRRVGICIPGGVAAYPSTVLMTVVPAQVAGVRELAVVAPPTPFGSENGDLLATCYELGITEVYRAGGAQAVAALAYGVEGLPAVDKIVGPGNLFVALAKRYVFGDVAIDSIAGPSEVVVIADETTPLEFAAADLIAQAEHAPGASILITTCQRLWEALPDELSRLLLSLPRGEVGRESLAEYGALVLVADAAAAADLANEIAPEHLQIATRDAESRLDQYRNAGAVFLGPYSPVALGDYVAGPSHVLPTGGTARFASGLSANDFLRSHSVIHYEQAATAACAADVGQLAEREGLTAHRLSVDLRRDADHDR